MNYRYVLSKVKLTTDEFGKEAVLISKLNFYVVLPRVLEGGKIQYDEKGITTQLSLREGEMVVVGTTNLGRSDEAMIVVVSVRKIK